MNGKRVASVNGYYRKNGPASMDLSIEVTGIRGTWGRETTFAASAIKHANRTIELRDSNGYPMWMTWQTDQNSEVYED